MKFNLKSILASLAALLTVGVSFNKLTQQQAQAITSVVVVAAAAFNPTSKPKS
jgi:hypothetical protein